MSSDFSGTNTEKIDKLVATTIELRTTLRICFAVVGIGFPLMVGLLVFLVVQSFSTAAKVDRLNETSTKFDRLTDQLATVRSEYVRLAERMDRLDRSARP